MRREDAEQLTNHYYRLYTSIRPIVDTSPPVSLYASPKSSFYRPFSMRKQQRPTNPQTATRHKGREELAHFLALKRTRSQSQLGFNTFARLKTESRLNLSELDLPQARSKLLDTRNYQPPLRLKLHTGDSPSSSASSAMNSSIKSAPLPPKPKQNKHPKTSERQPRQRLSDIYDQFKDRVLSEILLRNVFTNRVIEDCFQREIRRHPELEQRVLFEIMTETLAELGVKDHKRTTTPNKQVQSQKHVTISEKAKRNLRSASLSSGSRNSSSVQTSSSQSSASKPSPSSSSASTQARRTPINKLANNNSLNFRIDVSPPRTVSSLSSDIDEIVRRLSNTESYDLAEREPSLDDFETDSSDGNSTERNEFKTVMDRAKQKS